ncbi:MAG: zinc metalloprotease [Cycloclasticus sp. symbiont of Poecilosclerida sp. M]|nr:MAG: zinc metalloprotease [Cycloclasticus sp. symbiont of Poecilosclerida sp. M]
MTILISILSFIVALGVLVTVHEFGHFWVARRCGVKVLRFSVGFGKPLFSFHRKDDPTEYVIAGIPLGGYVKMLDEREGNVAEDEKHLAFNLKPLLYRIAIVLAGPAFNLMFALFAFWVILVVGEQGLKPIVGGVEKASVASVAGFQSGDEILTVAGRPASIWRVASGLMMTEILNHGSAEVSVSTLGGERKSLLLDLKALGVLEPKEISKQIGLKPELPVIKPVIGEVVEDEAADQAGLRTGDLILTANKKDISTWAEWVEITRANPSKRIEVGVERTAGFLTVDLVPKEIVENGEKIGRIGVSALINKHDVEQYYTVYSLGPIDSLVEAARLTYSNSWLTLVMIGRIIVGTASVENLSGPVTLAQYAGLTASIGFISFLKFLAFVSISLGVLNLLPIPMLDGGHLVFYFYEGLFGKAMPENAQAVFMRLGLFILLGVMLLAFFIDLSRLNG